MRAKRQGNLYNLFLKSLLSFAFHSLFLATNLNSAYAFSPNANQCSSIYSTSSITATSTQPAEEKPKSKNNYANGDHRVEIKALLDQYTFPEKFNVDKGDKILREAMYRAFKQKCLYTCMEIDRSQASVDHILPESQGGPNNIYNYVLAETNINSTKSDKFDEVAAIGLLSIVRLHFAPLVISEYQKIMIELFNIDSPKNMFSDVDFRNSEKNSAGSNNRFALQNSTDKAILNIAELKVKKLLFTYLVLAKSRSGRIIVSNADDQFVQIKMLFVSPDLQEVEKLQNFIVNSKDMKIQIAEQKHNREINVINSAELIKTDDGNLIFQFQIPEELLKWSFGMRITEALTLLENTAIPVESNKPR